MWKFCAPAELTHANLLALFENKVPAIKINCFASQAECTSFANACDLASMIPLVGESAAARKALCAKPLQHIGISQFEYQKRGPDAYLSRVQTAFHRTQRIFDVSLDPLDRLCCMLSACFNGGISVAAEPDGRAYFAGVIGLINHGVALHADFAPYQAPELSIGQVEAQLAWNFYAVTPPRGGTTHVFNAPWTVAAPPGQPTHNYPLSDGIVAGTAAFSFTPRAGEAWLFNSRNPHYVTESQGGNRLSVASFIGLAGHSKLILWS